MILLINFFQLVLNDPRIAREKKRKFIEDHLQRLAANNTANQYDLLINAMEAAYDAYFGKLTDRDTLFAIQQSRTQSMNNVKKLFIDTVQQREGLIRNFFNDTSPQYQEFFPNGLTEYDNSTLQNVETLMTRMVTACTNHQLVLGLPVVAEFTAIKNNFLLARGAQLVKKGEVTDKSAEIETAEVAVNRQFQINLLTLALEFLGDAEGLKFFDESIVRVPSNKDNDGLGRIIGTIKLKVVGTPIADAILHVEDGGINDAHSKNDGTFRTNNLVVGIYTITITKPGYKTLTLQVEIIDEGDTVLDAEMELES